MTTPGSSSETYAFNLSNSLVVLEAFDRIGIRPETIDRHMMVSARTSLNLELVSWSNRGINLWKIVTGAIDLTAAQATYQFPANLVTLTDIWFRTVDLTGAGLHQDRLMSPLTRTEYASIAVKGQTGSPNAYWFQRLQTPQVTVWPPPDSGAPTFVLVWYGLEQIQDAGIGGGESPDLVNRGMDALCAGLAKRLALKFAPDRLAGIAADASEAWALFAANDQESGPMIIQPNFSGYARIG